MHLYNIAGYVACLLWCCLIPWLSATRHISCWSAGTNPVYCMMCLFISQLLQALCFTAWLLRHCGKKHDQTFHAAVLWLGLELKATQIQAAILPVSIEKIHWYKLLQIACSYHVLPLYFHWIEKKWMKNCLLLKGIHAALSDQSMHLHCQYSRNIQMKMTMVNSLLAT